MHIDHLAIAVRNVEQAADRLCLLFGYARDTLKVTNTRQDVNVLFLRKVDSLPLKLIEPASETSPLWDFVRKGGGLHHVCFKAPDVGAACDERIAFLYAGLGLNVEVIDTDRRRGRLSEGA
jgi:methylmalonyl-CoA/ethylmalonyl-CoA epimerase